MENVRDHGLSPEEHARTIDQVNELKAENGQLRMRILAGTAGIANFNPSAGSSQCPSCSGLEDKINHLQSSLTSAMEHLARVEQSYSEDMLSADSEFEKLRTRQTRMEELIDRQRSVIASLKGYQKNPDPFGQTLPNQASGERHHGRITKDSESSFDDVDRSPSHPPIEKSFIPPWDLDMDDINRQLHDLTSTIVRVEQSTVRLGESAKAIPYNNEDRSTTSRADLKTRSLSSSKEVGLLLDRVYGFKNGFSS